MKLSVCPQCRSTMMDDECPYCEGSEKFIKGLLIAVPLAICCWVIIAVGIWGIVV